MTEDYFPLGVATGSAFCNREGEREQLAANIRAGRHTLLVAPRRYGKTSLSMKVLADLARRRDAKVVSAACDLLVCHDHDSVRDVLLEAVARLAARCVPLHRRALGKLGRFFTGLKPEIVVSTDGARLGFTPSTAAPETITRALSGVDRLAADGAVRAVLVMDEFQILGSLRGARPIEAAIRNVAQRAKRLAFVFSGSNRHMLSAMFDDAGRPLYHLCDRLVLGRIAPAAYRAFLRRAARARWKIALDGASIDAVLACTQCHPYYVNLLCARLWRAPDPPDADEVARMWQSFTTEESGWLAREVAALSPNQRAVLAALATEPTDKPQSKAFLTRTRLAAASNAQALQVLLERDLVYRDDDGWLRVLDPALGRYLETLAPAAKE
ncbi:MAG: hypothetical protein R3286_16105 [Gammaproteobacteria bacterium]|nr:hypothetical protein [Gammaproteobacteria bacterium]